MAERKKPYEQMLVEFNGLYNKYPATQVMSKLHINSTEFNSLLSDTLKANRENKTIKDSSRFEKAQYSENENDYGMVDRRKVMITKKGLFSFENSPLMEPYPTFISMAASEYKNMCNQNNIKYD